MWQVTEKTVFDDSTIVANLGGTVICIETARPRDIFSYNVYSEVWRKYKMPLLRRAPKKLKKPSYAVLGRDVFVFGGLSLERKTRNDFWQLTYDADGRLIWVNLCQKDPIKAPSPRVHHVMWAYANKVFSFGGGGMNPNTIGSYLPNSGEVEPIMFELVTNQLLQYDVATGEWTDVVSTGDIPSPGERYVCARIGGTVYVYQSDLSGDEYIYKLDLGTLYWTKVKLQGSPGPRYHYSFTAIDCERIVLYGKTPEGNPLYASRDIWVLDVTRNTWTKHDVSGPPRIGHSVIKHPTNEALLVFSGNSHPGDQIQPVSTVQLSSEPGQQQKPLLWYALKAVDQHREQTGLSGFPAELQKKLLLPGEKVSGLGDEDEV